MFSRTTQRPSKRFIAAALAALAALAAMPLAPEAQARTIALYLDPAASIGDAISAPLTQTLLNLGDTFSLFNNLDPTTLQTTLANADLLVLDGYNNPNLAASLTRPQVYQIREFLSSGGGLLVAGDRSTNALPLINILVGLDAQYAPDNGVTITARLSDLTPFDTAPNTLPNSPDALALTANLPEEITTFYGAPGLASIFGGVYDNGAFAYLAIAHTQPLAPGGDLERALQATTAYVADPTLIPLPTSAAAGVLLLAGIVARRVLHAARV